jgi:outer membrane beta-barrel protein
MKKIGLLLLFISTIGHAGNLPHAFTVTIADAYYDFANHWHYDNAALPNLALSYNVTDKWALEANAGYFNTKRDETDQHIHGALYMVDGIYRFISYGPLEPYLIGGLGMIRVNHNGNDAKHLGNVNGGIGTQFFWGDKIALRGEIRDVYSTTGSSRNDFFVNFGLSFLFGGGVSHSYKGEVDAFLTDKNANK